MSLPEEYRKLIELGINRSANLSDLNDMTDRGPFPMKPWTASKTCGTIATIHFFARSHSFIWNCLGRNPSNSPRY